MKVTPRFTVRAALVLTAAGVIGALGACKDGAGPPPPPVPPPPPPMAAPTALTGVPSQTSVALTWTDNATNETGFRLDRCTGAACSDFAQIGTNLAANATTYTDEGLTASTQYTYRIRAFNATDSSAWSAAATVTTTGIIGTPSFVMVGAGEITTCNSTNGPQGTAAIVKGILDADPDAIAFTVGNNLADPTAGSTYDGQSGCFTNPSNPRWGQFKDRTYFSIGNGDFDGGRGPSGVYGYLGNRTGPVDKGWFSFDKNNWHIVVLNTSDWQHGAPATFGIDAALNPAPSEQLEWLTADLTNNTKPCVMVISWERRLYTASSNTVGRQSNMRPMAALMYDKGVDILISAKDKLYSRFAPMNPTSATVDEAAGLRQFIVGTGGRTLDSPVPGVAPAGREAYLFSWGVLKLTLAESSYSWDFLTSAGSQDSGTTACH